jgi:hypothetical protein
VRALSLPLEGLKWGMAALMVLDHVAFIFFPDLTFLRIPGRLVWPMFALVELLARRKVVLAALAHGAWMWLSGWAPAYALLGSGAVLLAWALAEKARPGRRTPWWALYAFYPGHLAPLAAVRSLLD